MTLKCLPKYLSAVSFPKHELYYTPLLSNWLPTPDWKINWYQFPLSKPKLFSHLFLSIFYRYHHPCPFLTLFFLLLLYLFISCFACLVLCSQLRITDLFYSPYGIYTHIMPLLSVAVTTFVLLIALVFSHFHFHSDLSSYTGRFKLQCLLFQSFELYFSTC